MRKLNNSGSVLVISYMVLGVLVTLSAGVALLGQSEINNARRYENSAGAFWLAEAGINMFMKNTAILDEKNPLKISYGNGTIQLSKDDTDLTKRKVTATGRVSGSQRKIEIVYPVEVPRIFRNTFSVKGDIVISGGKSSFLVQDKARLSGKVVTEAKYVNSIFEDLKDGISSEMVGLSYPDADHNGKADEFGDFIETNKGVIAQYSKKEIMHIQGDDTITLAPTKALEQAKIVFVEGKEGKGDVIIPFSALLKEKQQLTVITTGTVFNNLMGDPAPNSQLNIISWKGYSESAAFPGSFRGLVYTHGKATFSDIYDSTETRGSIVANEGLVLGDIWSVKTFKYEDPRVGGLMPPGFEGLESGIGQKYSARPDSWREI